METKICNKCRIEKSLSQFRKKDSKGYIRSVCKECDCKQRGTKYTGKTRIKEKIKGDKKLCTKCLKWFPATLEYFFKSSENSTGFNSWCKNCIRERDGVNKRATVDGDKKLCTKCKEIKLLSEFSIRKDNKTGYKSHCKNCVNNYGKRRYNPDYEKFRKRFRTDDYTKPKYRLINSKRRAAKLQALPKWVDMVEVKKIYARAVRLTKETGISHEVDHIDPLQNPLVCGLHVHQNLQVLTESENCRKHNKFTPYGVDSNGKQYRLYIPSLFLESMIERFKRLDHLNLYYISD